MLKKPKKTQRDLKLRLKPEQRKRVFKISDQLLALVLDPSNTVDTEMIVYYIKSKIK